MPVAMRLELELALAAMMFLAKRCLDAKNYVFANRFANAMQLAVAMHVVLAIALVAKHCPAAMCLARVVATKFAAMDFLAAMILVHAVAVAFAAMDFFAAMLLGDVLGTALAATSLAGLIPSALAPYCEDRKYLYVQKNRVHHPWANIVLLPVIRHSHPWHLPMHDRHAMLLLLRRYLYRRPGEVRILFGLLLVPLISKLEENLFRYHARSFANVRP